MAETRSELWFFSFLVSNAVATAQRVLATMKELSKRFPEGLEYRVVHNPTVFVEQSIYEVYRSLFAASVLVTLVIFLFLQSAGHRRPTDGNPGNLLHRYIRSDVVTGFL